MRLLRVIDWRTKRNKTNNKAAVGERKIFRGYIAEIKIRVRSESLMVMKMLMLVF
jgi:hypothetical protein